MKVRNQYFEILDRLNGKGILKKIEKCGRVCYKSEGKIKDGSARKMVAGLIKSGHDAMLEHASVTVKFVVDRGISHELVRHRMASFAQESTRYCNYIKDDFGSEITFIIPKYLDGESAAYDAWKDTMKYCEDAYFYLLNIGFMPQEARAVLPNSTKTEVVMTANLREWRHFFKLRALGTTGKPHPQMLEVTIPLLEDFKRAIPVVFDDLIVK